MSYLLEKNKEGRQPEFLSFIAVGGIIIIF